MLSLSPFLHAALVLPIALVLATALATPVLAERPRAATGADTGNDATINFRTDDRRMNAAKAKARRTLPDFLAVLAAPPAGATDFAFKYPLAGWEHIWVDHVERRGDSLVGQLANDPIERGYRQGQRVTVPLAEVSDWSYRDARGVMQGHFTTRVMLPRMDPVDARALREGFGWATRSGGPP